MAGVGQTIGAADCAKFKLTFKLGKLLNDFSGVRNAIHEYLFRQIMSNEYR